MNISKFMGIHPFIFNIIHLEIQILWDTIRVSNYQPLILMSPDDIYYSGWMGDKSFPITWHLGYFCAVDG